MLNLTLDVSYDEQKERVLLKFPFLAPFINYIKLLVPHSLRSYDPATNTWSIAPNYLLLMSKVIKNTFAKRIYHNVPPQHKAAIEWGTTTASGASMTLEECYAYLHLLPSAPTEVVRSVYKTMCASHHPDAGGSHEQMALLNYAHDTIMKGRQ